MTSRVDPIPREVRGYQGRRAGVVTRNVAGVIDIGVVALLLVGALLRLLRSDLHASAQRLRRADPAVLAELDRGLLGDGAVPRAVLVHRRALLRLPRDGPAGGQLEGRPAAARSPSLLRAAFLVAFPLGFYWVVISPANRSLQDVVLRTSVIYDWDVRPHPHAARAMIDDQ